MGLLLACIFVLLPRRRFRAVRSSPTKLAYLATRQPTTPAFTGSPVLAFRHVPFDHWQR
jgi:hypothetical protein